MKSLGHFHSLRPLLGCTTGLQARTSAQLRGERARSQSQKDQWFNVQRSLTFLAPRISFLEDHFSWAGDKVAYSSGCGEAWGRASSSHHQPPTAHLLQSCLVPNSMQAGTGPQSGGCGPLFNGRRAYMFEEAVVLE